MTSKQAKEDWRILRALSDRFAQPLPYNNSEALRKLIGSIDHRYALDASDDKDSAELSLACDHSPVSVGLAPLAVTASAAGMLLLTEPAFYHNDAMARHSAILAKLDQGQNPLLGSLRINPNDAAKQKIQTGQKVRLIHGERSLEMVAELDSGIPENVVFGRSGYAAVLVQTLCDWSGGFPQVSLVGL